MAKKKHYVALRTRMVQAAEIKLFLEEGEPVDVPASLVDEFIAAGYIEEAS